APAYEETAINPGNLDRRRTLWHFERLDGRKRRGNEGERADAHDERPNAQYECPVDEARKRGLAGAFAFTRAGRSTGSARQCWVFRAAGGLRTPSLVSLPHIAAPVSASCRLGRALRETQNPHPTLPRKRGRAREGAYVGSRKSSTQPTFPH